MSKNRFQAVTAALRGMKLPCDTTVRQLELLEILANTNDRSEKSVRSLARRMGVQKAIVTRSMNRLSEFGLAERTYDPNDKRQVYCDILPRGAELLELVDALDSQDE